MAENVSSLGEETDIQIQEAQRIPNKTRPTPKHTTIKMSKVKDS